MVKVNPRLVTMTTLAVGIAVIIVLTGVKGWIIKQSKGNLEWCRNHETDADSDIIIPVSFLPNQNLPPTNWDWDGLENSFFDLPTGTEMDLGTVLTEIRRLHSRCLVKISNAIALELLLFTHFWSSS